ncbi:MAG: hypothetical protein OSB14_05760 [Planctomycetota bacterium]|nr:hypothetical protein [Planctomycetota bacterium]
MRRLRLPVSSNCSGAASGAEELGWPESGRAILWLEAGAGAVMPVVNTPEEIERLQQLGYVR